MAANSTEPKSWWAKTFGRSVLSMLVGNFFEKKNNAAAIIAILLTASLCYVIVFREKYEYITGLLNILFVVIGYYFGAKQGEQEKGDEQPNP